ncbi:MAG: hypothetical protein ABSH03_22675 [Candidatus Lustribacter sp.]
MVIEPLLGAMYCGPRARLDDFLPGIVTVKDIVTVGGAVAPPLGEVVGGLAGVPPEALGARLLPPPPPPPQAVTSVTSAADKKRKSCFLINRASCFIKKFVGDQTDWPLAPVKIQQTAQPNLGLGITL